MSAGVLEDRLKGREKKGGEKARIKGEGEKNRITKGKKWNVHEVRGECQYYCFLGYEDVGSDCKTLPFHQITQHHIPEQNNLTRIAQH